METRWTLRLICKTKKKEPSNANDTEHVTHRENIRKEKEKYHHQKIKIHTLIEAEEKNARKYLRMTHGNGSITISSWLPIFCFYVWMNFLLLCYSTATKTSTAILLTWITEETERRKKNEQESVHLKYFTPHIHSSHRDAPYELKHWK